MFNLQYATLHAILGFVATGLLLCQLIGGFLRPAGDHSRRPIFNWGHRIGGILALISAGKPRYRRYVTQITLLQQERFHWSIVRTN